MKPSDYLDQVIRPLVAEFHREPTSLHRLFAAITTTYHIVDYLRKSADLPKKSEEQVRQALESREPCFRAIYYVCLAQKHVIIENQNLNARGINTHVEDVKNFTIEWSTDEGQSLAWFHQGKPVTWFAGFRVEIKDQVYELESCLKGVLRCLDDHLAEIEKELRQMKRT